MQLSHLEVYRCTHMKQVLCVFQSHLLSPVIRTFSTVHMRAAYLVHQQHEDEAEHQRHADAGVELLVAVLVFPAGTQN